MNLQFLDEEVRLHRVQLVLLVLKIVQTFTSRGIASGLLALHATLLVAFGLVWCRAHGGFFATMRKTMTGQAFHQDTAQTIVRILFISNFVGIVCARTLHYQVPNVPQGNAQWSSDSEQFYSWYAHSLPFLTAAAGLHSVLSACLLGTIELAFVQFPPSATNSLMLQVGDLVVM